MPDQWVLKERVGTPKCQTSESLKNGRAHPNARPVSPQRTAGHTQMPDQWVLKERPGTPECQTSESLKNGRVHSNASPVLQPVSFLVLPW